MSKESEMKALLIADAPLMAILTGGVFTDQELGVEGIRREPGTITENAYDADGEIKPLAVIREGQTAPYGPRSVDVEIVSQPIFIYFIEFRGHDQVDLAKERTKVILKGKRLGRSFPIWHLVDMAQQPDSGPVLNSTVLQQVWQCVFTKVYA